MDRYKYHDSRKKAFSYHDVVHGFRIYQLNMYLMYALEGRTVSDEVSVCKPMEQFIVDMTRIIVRPVYINSWQSMLNL